MNAWKPGDTANGYVLGGDGVWYPEGQVVDRGPVVAPEHRRGRLQEAMQPWVATGLLVETSSDYAAVLASPTASVNHVVHGVLTLMTCGLWAPMWMIFALFTPKPTRYSLSVDAYGLVTVRDSDGNVLQGGTPGFAFPGK